MSSRKVWAWSAPGDNDPSVTASVTILGALGIGALSLASTAGATQLVFEDVAEQAGVAYRNSYGGIDAKRFILETTGNGAVFFDYDEDGDQDLFLVSGTRLGASELSPEDDEISSNTLYRNNGDGTFDNVTVYSGLERYGWGQGAAASDTDNDGDLDLLVTYFGPNLFYRNNGDGSFTELGQRAGIANSSWGASGAFADYDLDGFNDLFVANYVDFDLAATPGPGEAPNCFFMGLAVMCGPKGLPPAQSVLYRNRGDGSFEDVTGKHSGVAGERFFGLGAVWGDVDNDGDADLYVANDQTPNNLYRNEGNGRFTDMALSAGVAYNEDGRAQAGMGVDFGDFDNDGLIDLHVTNFSHDYNTLYHNTGRGYFIDVSFQVGLGEASYAHLGWGTGFRDFDLDGWLDIFVSNGHVYPEVSGSETQSDYAQRSLLFLNSEGVFDERGAQSGLTDRRVGRGAAFADYDNDGDIDIVVSNMNQGASVLRNGLGGESHWIGLRLIGRNSARDALGARAMLFQGEGRQIREVRSGASYLSQSDLRLHFGLGETGDFDRIDILWPLGCRQIIDSSLLDRYTVLLEPPSNSPDCGTSEDPR